MPSLSARTALLHHPLGIAAGYRRVHSEKVLALIERFEALITIKTKALIPVSDGLVRTCWETTASPLCLVAYYPCQRNVPCTAK